MCDFCQITWPPALTEAFFTGRIKIVHLRNVNVFHEFCVPHWSDEKIALNLLPLFWWSNATTIWFSMFELILTRIRSLTQQFFNFSFNFLPFKVSPRSVDRFSICLCFNSVFHLVSSYEIIVNFSIGHFKFV